MPDTVPNPALRWTAIILLSFFGLVLALISVLVPSHFRAIDAQVVANAGIGTDTLLDAGIEELETNRIGTARLFLSAAQLLELDHAADLERLVGRANQWQKDLEGVDELDWILRNDPWALQWDGASVVKLLSPPAARARVREHLAGAFRSAVLDVVQTRELPALKLFSPANSSAGQPYEIACLTTALLLQHGILPLSLKSEIESLALLATRKGDTQPLELFYMDLISLGNRMNWAQLTSFMAVVEDVDVMRDAANLMRREKERWPVLVAVMIQQGRAAAVTGYLLDHAKTGQKDLRFAARHGRGSVATLLASGQRIHRPFWRESLVAYEPFTSVFGTWSRLTGHSPGMGLALRYLLLVLASILVGRAVIDLMPAAEGIAVKRWFSPAHWAILGALLVLGLALFEPFLFQKAQTLSFPLHWKLPKVGEAIRESISQNLKPIMSVLTILALVFFLVLQGIIYVVCLLKLADIRRQPVSSETKLRLLENEENMFDAGLYCGLGGTVASLVLLAMGIFEASLMAAYTSTLFGIIFVAILKIFHLRPYRRRLIMESEA